MNNLSIIFIAVLILPLFSCEEKIDIEKEKEAIKAVIMEESDAFYNRDYDRQAACYIQNDMNLRMGSSKTMWGYIEGWDKISQGFMKHMEDNPDPIPRDLKLSDWKIKIYSDSAWAVFKDKDDNIGVRFFEKEDGKWKIILLSAIMVSSYEEDEQYQ